MIAATQTKLLRQCRTCVWIIIIGLALSGITAFPIEAELRLLVNCMANNNSILHNWLNTVYEAVKCTNQSYPYLSYGTDWLAFAHLVLAVLFIGPLRHPVKNKWVIEFGMIAAAAIFPLAFIAGGIRGIPVFWRLVDCSFGAIALVPLVICYRGINKLAGSGFST